MNDRHAFDRQLEREIDNLAGPEPRFDVREVVETAARPSVRPSRSWLVGFLRFAAAAAVVAVFGFVLVLGWPTGEQQVVVPAASPSGVPAPSASPGASTTTPVSGSWFMPDPPACRDEVPSLVDAWIERIEICEGLRFSAAADPRLSGTGVVRRETWRDAQAPEVWHVDGPDGSWESERYHDHDRFVFRGRGGYDGLTAVVTLSADGTLSGFVRTGEPREDDQ